jgi:thiol:disulfide interchange protein DsbD
MGATLVVTSFTCTAPFVGSLLSVGAADGDLGRIVLGMGTFGLTMAIPFVLLSLVPGRIQAMPKSGEWMNTLKFFLGFVEIAAAFKFLSNTDLVLGWNILSREVFLLLWGVIFTVAALYLFGVLFKSHGATRSPKRMASGVLTLAFAVYCLTGFRGREMDYVMTAVIPPYSWSGESDQISWVMVENDYDSARELALVEGKKLFLNFTGYT